MKKLIVILSFIALLGFGACTKTVELDIIESRCKDFRIDNATYQFKINSCPKNISGNTITVFFNYNGDQECLNSIDMEVKFFNSSDNQIFPVSLTPDSLFKTDLHLIFQNAGRMLLLAHLLNSFKE